MTGKSSRKKKNGKKLVVVIIAAAVALAIIAVIGIFAVLNHGMEPVDAASTEIRVVEVPNGSTTGSIAADLVEAGLIRSAEVFKIESRLKGVDGTFKAGIYELSPSMGMEEIMRLLIKGHDATLRFTVPEGFTLQQITERLAEENLIDTNEFCKLLKNGDFDYWFLKDAPDGENRLEGYLYPETYEVFSDASEEDIIKKMLDQFGSVFTEDMGKRAETMGYSINEIITIASMIERETIADSERNLVASVIYNRLNQGMKLGIDATVQYALGEQKEYLSSKDIKVDSPYNTYQIKGLPPGPICSPSAASIKAALYPAETDYIYYVLKPDNSGCHNFSADYKTFEKNKKAYKAYHGLQ